MDSFRRSTNVPMALLTVLSTLSSLPAQARPTPSVDDRLTRTPVFQMWDTGATVGSITNAASTWNVRPIDIEVTNVSPLLFDVAFVRNSKEYAKRWRLVTGQNQVELGQLCEAEDYRITDLERYVVNGQVKYAAILEDNRGINQKNWRWFDGGTFADLRAFCVANDMRIVDLERYSWTGTMLCAGVVIENSGRDHIDWAWALNQSAAQVRDRLQALGHRAYVLERQVDGQYDLISVRHDDDTLVLFGVTTTYAESARRLGHLRMLSISRHPDNLLTVVMTPNSGFFTQYGTSCDSGFAHTGAGNPAPGQTIQLRLIAPTYYTSWVSLRLGAQAIALDLGTVGAAGCHLLVDTMASIPLLASGGGASAQFTVPNTASMIGSSFHTQFVMPWQGANLLGLKTTKGLRTTIGPVQ